MLVVLVIVCWAPASVVVSTLVAVLFCFFYFFGYFIFWGFAVGVPLVLRVFGFRALVFGALSIIVGFVVPIAISTRVSRSVFVCVLVFGIRTFRIAFLGLFLFRFWWSVGVIGGLAVAADAFVAVDGEYGIDIDRAIEERSGALGRNPRAGLLNRAFELAGLLCIGPLGGVEVDGDRVRRGGRPDQNAVWGGVKDL